MRRHYTNPPILESLFELRLPQDSPWDLTIPGLIYEKIKESFPHKEQRLIPEMEINQTSQAIQHQTRSSERILFFSEDRKKLIQVSERLLVVNWVKPYSGWESFGEVIRTALQAIGETLEAKRIQRLGLRYINKIEVPKNFDLINGFDFRPFLGTHLPKMVTGFLLACDFQFTENRDVCRVTLSKGEPDNSENQAFILDLDYFLAMPSALAFDDAKLWIEQAHTNLESVFEGCLTKQLRSVFKEEK